MHYCNALLYGTSERNISKLQRVQSAVARAVDCRPRRAHMRPVLAKFHWLSIRKRLHYKMALLAYQGRVGLLPRYLSTLLLIINRHELCVPGSVRHCCRHAVYEMNWLGALLEWQFLLCGTLCLRHLDLPPHLILSRLD